MEAEKRPVVQCCETAGGKKNILATVALSALGCALVGFGVFGVLYLMNDKKSEPEPVVGNTITKIYDQVLDAGTYTELDEEYVINYLSEKYDGWGSKSACSAAVTTTEDGHTVMGRSMDLTISDKPAYVFRTDVEGQYKTIGLQYTNFSGPDTDEVLENGISEHYEKILPYLASDVMNEYGLYIEQNMRTDEYYEDNTGKFSSSGTNPGAEVRLPVSMLPLYLTTHAKTIDEALELLDTLDVYSINSDLIAWPFAWLMSDGTGNYGLLEIVNNEVIWHEKQAMQTNFYVAEKYAEIEDVKFGTGRYEYMEENLASVKTKKDMFDLMDGLTYSDIYRPATAKFDIRSDYIGVYEGWTYDYIMDEANQAEVAAGIQADSDAFMSATREEKVENGGYWESVFTIVADSTDKTIYVRFFEDETRSLNLHF